MLVKLMKAFLLISFASNFYCAKEMVIYPDQLPCLSYARNLSIIASNFLNCALTNSRPLTICANCLEFYLQFEETYNLMADVI